MSRKRAAFHTLGCRVNQYETEAMKQGFRDLGYEIVGEEDPADVYVVNTCTVTGLADRKSRQYIRRMKRNNPDAVMCAAGCYVQSDPEAVEAVEELDILLGTNEKYKAAALADAMLEGRIPRERRVLVDPYDSLTEFVEAGRVTSPDSRSRANVKIQDGCDRFCSYCVIPLARGHVRSRKKENVIGEVAALTAAGFREVVLTGINTALYDDLPGLLKELDEMPGDFRVRLASLEPTVVDAPFVAGLMTSRRLCHQLHLSIQSGSDTVLARMNRHYTGEDYMRIVDVLREIDPLFNITTDIIVGFPGETEEEFSETLALAERVRFGRIHAFKYSRRPGTKAADMPDQVPEPVKKERSRRLQELGRKLTAEYCARHRGTVQRVLAEERVDGRWEGYTDDYSRTVIEHEPAGGIREGTFVTCRVIGSDGDRLSAEPADGGPEWPADDDSGQSADSGPE